MVHDVTASPFVCPDTASLDSRRCKSTTSSLFFLFQTPRSLCVCVCVCVCAFISYFPGVTQASTDSSFTIQGIRGIRDAVTTPPGRKARPLPQRHRFQVPVWGPFLHLLPCPWPGIQTLHLQQDPTSVDLQRATHQRPALVVIDHSRRYRQLTPILRLLYPPPPPIEVIQFRDEPELSGGIRRRQASRGASGYAYTSRPEQDNGTGRTEKRRGKRDAISIQVALRPSSPPVLEAWERHRTDRQSRIPQRPGALLCIRHSGKVRAHLRPTGVLVPPPVSPCRPRRHAPRAAPPWQTGRPSSQRAAQNRKGHARPDAHAPRLLGTAQCECDGRPLVSDKGRAQPPPAASRWRRRRSLSVCRCRRRHQPRRDRQPTAFLVARPCRDTASVAAKISKLHRGPR